MGKSGPRKYLWSSVKKGKKRWSDKEMRQETKVGLASQIKDHTSKTAM